MPDETASIKLREDSLDWLASDGETVILDERAERYIAANEAASTLWPLLASGTTITAMASQLVETYGIDRDTAETDAAALVDQLNDLGLLDA